MIRFIRLSSHLIDQLFRKIVLVFFITATILAVLQVVNRFLIGIPFPWSEELIRYLFVWFVFLGISMVYKAKGHASVELLTSMLSKRYKKGLSIVSEIMCILFFLMVLIQGYNLFTVTLSQVSPSMQLNMGFVYISVPIFAVACMIHSLDHLFAFRR